jgi:glycosyltransferase involved in cell wall biosynthesis
MNICILIPAHNEAKNVGRLTARLRGKGLEVIVVDDGSVDGTGQVAKDAGAVVLTNTQNQGKGFSLQRGFDYIVSRDYDALITMDGDGQHAFEDIDKFIALFREKTPDIICGNRMANHQGMPLVRLVTNKIMSGLISLVCRQKIYDSQCGYRLIKPDVLRNVQLSSSAFEIESEVLIKSAKKGYRIASVPVRTIYAGEKSRINPFFDTVRFIVYIVRELFVR